MSRPKIEASAMRYLFTSILLIVAVAILVTGAWVSAQRDAFVREGEQTALLLAYIARATLSNEEPQLLEQVTYGALGSRNVQAVRIHERDGTPVVDIRRKIQALTPEGNLSAYVLKLMLATENENTFSAPVYPPLTALSNIPPNIDESTLGWVEIELSTDEFARYSVPPLGSAFSFALFAAVLLAAIALVRAHRQRQALISIHDTIQRLKRGNLEARTDVHGRGALPSVADELNAMADALNRAQLELEQKVEQTTSELRETLEAVEIQNVELDLARKRALEASKVKSEFLANMSHEIRTPINGILGFADLLAHSPLDEEQRDYINTVKDSCANLLTIVNDILDFSKIEAGKLAIDSVAFDLRDSVEEVLSLLAPTAYGKALELLHLIYADVPLKLFGDPIRIRQVLTNLAHNAIKFTPSGRVIVRVMLEDESEQDALLRITVEDTGIGLSEEDQSRLFTAFGQADTSITRRFGGAGLGLIISRKLVEQMGGAITAANLTHEPSTASCHA
ncbi:hypothetical protein CAI21_12215 [Alkalilimnicola ehrlichii]|uniref:histidine kinase dimerization/phospho-acceptor domain-containing protein n=1 Tax=Alkalilimnicola ehrlichii TaxID=351052 RepID=UPI000E2FEB4F|nr:histidine kinase dimerization/phospho-acceptor domain-containing protein [Alkalilimnicola ehrlichii]RFA28342.1 hypothetical protein CAI21_12215 [Alkalilimnicola ehrlichii]